MNELEELWRVSLFNYNLQSVIFSCFLRHCSKPFLYNSKDSPDAVLEDLEKPGIDEEFEQILLR